MKQQCKQHVVSGGHRHFTSVEPCTVALPRQPLSESSQALPSTFNAILRGTKDNISSGATCAPLQVSVRGRGGSFQKKSNKKDCHFPCGISQTKLDCARRSWRLLARGDDPLDVQHYPDCSPDCQRVGGAPKFPANFIPRIDCGPKFIGPNGRGARGHDALPRLHPRLATATVAVTPVRAATPRQGGLGGDLPRRSDRVSLPKAGGRGPKAARLAARRVLVRSPRLGARRGQQRGRGARTPLGCAVCPSA